MFGLRDNDIEKLQSVFIRFPEVEKVVLYGSRAKGNYHDRSDIDLTMRGSRLDGTVSAEIAQALDDLLLPYMIDLSVYDRLSNPDLIEHINRAGKLFYKK
ncbi:MAG: nucleotidyltransferase domain-containing protein [Prevotellaceae bacterium]|jgi:predicted nucleotidyltransferase|nr:nucleotidyltransferase domain-containing protein [Prevotellaceae bacterium]